MEIKLLSADQTSAAVKHVYTMGGTVITVMVGLALIPAESLQPALDALHQMGDGMKQLMGGASALWGIIGPVIVGVAVKAGIAGTSFKAQLASVTKTAANGDPDAKKQMIAATASLPVVEKIIAPTVAEDIPSTKVTSQ